ncbi:hypothetical protein HYW18_03810 [Candidatus Uhrbacteria bacterium]|nr:hypothetical protein [Candidatus Uhrbacteria bacterium]
MWTLLLNTFLLVASLVLGILYVSTVNVAAQMGYEMKDLQTRVDELAIANQQLEYRAADNRAMYNVARRVSILGMVRPESVSYVPATTPAVAVAP